MSCYFWKRRKKIAAEKTTKVAEELKKRETEQAAKAAEELKKKSRKGA